MTWGAPAGASLSRTVAPAAIVPQRQLLRPLFVAHRFELLGRGVALVGMALVEQLLCNLRMTLRPVGLEQGRRVVVETEPIQPVDDLVDGILRGSLAIGVFDPQQRLAAMMAGKEPVEQRSARAADVEISCGRRREAGDDRHGRGRGAVARGFACHLSLVPFQVGSWRRRTRLLCRWGRPSPPPVQPCRALGSAGFACPVSPTLAERLPGNCGLRPRPVVGSRLRGGDRRVVRAAGSRVMAPGNGLGECGLALFAWLHWRGRGEREFLRVAAMGMCLVFALGVATIWSRSEIVGTPPLSRPYTGPIEGTILTREEQPAEGRVRLTLAVREPETGRALQSQAQRPSREGPAGPGRGYASLRTGARAAPARAAAGARRLRLRAQGVVRWLGGNGLSVWRYGHRDAGYHRRRRLRGCSGGCRRMSASA